MNALSIANTAVEIFDLAGNAGSGVLLGPRLVLTSLHAVAGVAGGGLRVRAGTGTDGTWRSSVSVWIDKKLDAALISPSRGGRPFRERGSFPLLRFGKIGEGQHGCRLLGFPTAAGNEEAGHLNAIDLEGTIRPHAYERERFFGCTVNNPVASGRLWRGMSGGPVLVGRWLAGLIMERAQEFDAALLKCRPVAPLLDIAGFRALLEKERSGSVEGMVDELDGLNDEASRGPRLTPNLEREILRLGRVCSDAGRPLRNTHRLYAVFALQNGYPQAVFNSIESGLGEKVERWLRVGVEQEALRPPLSRGIVYRLENDLIMRKAQSLAISEGSRHVDERQWLLCSMREKSGTTTQLEKALTSDVYRNLLTAVARYPVPAAFERDYGKSDLDILGVD